MARETEQEALFDPHRKLCPDGTCIGVVGDDGKCTVCRTAASGDVSAFPEQGIDPAQDDFSEPSEAEEASSGFDPNRRLCSDDSCVGVLGSDGRCPVCGKLATQ